MKSVVRTLPGLLFLIMMCMTGVAQAQVLQVYDTGNEPATLHPLFLGYSRQGLLLSSLITERAARIDASKNQLTLSIFESSTQKSQQRYELKLRPDLKWSDGTIMSAQDVENSFTRLSRLASSGSTPAVEALFNSLSLVERIEAIDAERVQVMFRLPVQSNEVTTLIALLPILPAAASDEVLTKPNAPVSGPFIVKSVSEKDIQLEANPHYYLGKPKYEKLTLNFINLDQLQALVNNEGSSEVVVRLPSKLLSSLKKSPNVILRPLNARRIVYLGFNRNYGSIFEEFPDLRAAISSFVDRQGLKDGLKDLAGGGPLISSPFGYSSAFNDPEVESIPYSPAVGSSRLQDVGFRRVGETYRTEKGRNLKLRILVYEGVQNYDVIISLLKEQLEREGITVESQTINESELQALFRNKSGNYDMILHEWMLDDGEEILDLYHSKAPYNFLSYKNSALDERLLLERRASLSNSKLLYRREMHRIISRDLPAIYLWQTFDFAAFRPDIQDAPPLDGYFFFRDVHLWKSGKDQSSLLLPMRPEG